MELICERPTAGGRVLLEDYVGLRFMSAGGEDDGCAENQRSASPRIRTEMFAKQLDAEP